MKKGFELNASLRTIYYKPRCTVHWVRSEPCLSNPSAPGRNLPNLPVRTIAQSVRRPGIKLGNSIVPEAGYAAKNSCQQTTNQLPLLALNQLCAAELTERVQFIGFYPLPPSWDTSRAFSVLAPKATKAPSSSRL
jgi:hypothetical protein